MYMLLCVSNTVMSNVRLIMAKNQATAKQHLEAKLLLIENYSFSSSTWMINAKIIENILKNVQKASTSV